MKTWELLSDYRDLKEGDKKVTVIIPTCDPGRIPLLTQTIESIWAGSYKDIHIVVVADGNPHIYDTIEKFFHIRHRMDSASVVLNRERMDWIFSTNRILREFDSEYYIYASDDLIFPQDCIQGAMICIQRHFPDGFGVITLGKKNRCIFGLFGRKMADHFPDRQVFCPDYIHYVSDTEFGIVVKKLGLFAYPPERENQVKHLRMKDGTWRLAQKNKRRDFYIRKLRGQKGFEWGIDFNLIRGEKRCLGMTT